LNDDGFTGVCILAQNKENSWNDWDKDLNFTKKNPNLFLNWDLLEFFELAFKPSFF
jgi:hypothetical protein